MKIHQLIYNSSASTLTGGSGFGVRAVSEGIPQEYINLVNDKSLNSYSSGKFNLFANLILASPEKIYEYPKGYYYKIVQVKDKPVYLIARVVYTCFDHSYYVTGKSTRPGNYIVHLFLSDEYPGKKVFNLLAESSEESGLSFIPHNWTPVQDNNELVSLMVGKQETNLPDVTGNFPDAEIEWDSQTLDLLFSYRVAKKEQKPIVVSMNHTITPSTVSKFMRLLPESLAKDTTFVINHQSEGPSKDVTISFVNEYYQYTIYPNLCSHINLIDNSRKADIVESIWRPVLEESLKANDIARTELLINWIFSSHSNDNAGLSAELNVTLFNYCNHQSLFSTETIDKVQNILEHISKYIKDGHTSADHLNSLITEISSNAADLETFAKAISYCEKVHKASIDTTPSREYIKNAFTEYLVKDCCLLYDAFALLKDPLLRKYTIQERYPKFNVVVPDLLLKKEDMQQIVQLAKYLEVNAGERVTYYLDLLDKNPGMLSKYTILLDSDKFEADKADYIGKFKSHHNNPEFGHLFYQQIKRESSTVPFVELSRKIFNLSEVNTGFTKYILTDDQLFITIFNKLKRVLKEEDYIKTRKAIADYILSLLLIESVARKSWQLMYDVLNLNLPDRRKAVSYYNLAKEIKHIDAMKMVAPLCFGSIESDNINDFLSLIKQNNLMELSKVIECVMLDNCKNKLEYVLQIANIYVFDYDKIYELVSKCVNDEKEAKEIIKTNFKQLYSQHKKDVFIGKIKSLFSKKENNDDENKEANEKQDEKKEKNKKDK